VVLSSDPFSEVTFDDGNGDVPSEPTPIDQRRDEILAALAPLGVDAADVEIEAGSPSDRSNQPDRVQVEVPVGKLPGIADRVASAVQGVIGPLPTQGVVFGSAKCDARRAQVRRRAVADGRRRAQRLAKVAGVDIGGVRAVDSVLDGGSGVRPDPCKPEAVSRAFDPYETSLSSFDDDPRVTVSDDLEVTFGIDGADANDGVTGDGNSIQKGTADRAIVVVSSGPRLGAATESPEERALRTNVAGRLEAAGLAPHGVRVRAGGLFDDGTTVRVPVDVQSVAESGPKIRAIVRDVFRGVGQAGVIFTSTQCASLAVRAQRVALSGARRELRRLAKASDSSVGSIVGVSDVSSATAAVLSTGLPIFGTGDPAFDVDRDCLTTTAGLAGILEPGPLASFDSKPVVEVGADVSLTRAVD
jgi:hypothetical protein